MSIDQIRHTISQYKGPLRDSYKVREIGIFGSAVRGQDTGVSDLDLLVEFSEPIGLFRFIELEEFLTKVIGKKVDLVTKKALKPAIKEEILREVVYT